MKYCQNCGNKMEDSDNFCLSCGAKSIIPDVSPRYPNMQYPNIPYPYPRKRVNPLAIILPVAAVLIIGAVLLIVLLTGGNTPSGVVQRYLDASKRGDMKAAMECMAPDARDAANIFMDAIGLTDEDMISAAGGFGLKQSDNSLLKYFDFKYRILNEHVEGNYATVDVQIEAYGNTIEQTLSCVNENGRWYIPLY